MDSLNYTLNILQDDLLEVEELLTMAKQVKVTRFLEDYKLNILNSIKIEKKSLEFNKAKMNSIKHVEEELKFATIQKYSWSDMKKTGK